MDNNESNKHNVLKKLSILLTLINIGMFVFFVFAIFREIGNFIVLLIIEIVLVLSSFVFAMKIKKSSKEIAYILNAFIFVVSPIMMMLGGIKESHNQYEIETQRRIDKLANIEYLKEHINNSTVYLTDSNSNEYFNKYADKEDKIKNKFVSLSFSATTIIRSDITFPIEFLEGCGEGGYYCASFSADYTYLEIFASDEAPHSYVTSRSIYSLGNNDAQELKQMIMDEIDNQKQMYKEETISDHLNEQFCFNSSLYCL